MKDSGQKLTRHKRIHKRMNRRRNSPSESLAGKRERRAGFAEALKDGELHLFKRKRERTYQENISRLMTQDKASFREYWVRKKRKESGLKSPIPTALKAKHIEEGKTSLEDKSQQKSFFQKMKTGIRNMFQRKAGQK